MHTVYDEILLQNNVNTLMSNGAYSLSHGFCGGKLPDYKCQNGKTIKVNCLEEYLCEVQCKVMVNAEFGFEMRLIKIKPNREGFFGYYCATDYNYIRFEVCGRQYEMVDGYLEFVIE